MPPKRKIVEGSTGPVSTRATRSSTRTSSGKAEEKEKPKPKPKVPRASTKKAKDESGSDKEEPPAKRPKITKTNAASRPAKTKKNTTDGEPGQSAKPQSKIARDGKSNLEAGPYQSSQALDLFQKYADPDDPPAIGPAGLEQLCNEAVIPMDGAMPLILAWQLDAKEMGKFTKDEWLKGTSKLKISSLPPLVTALSDLDNLLILSKSPVKSNSKTDPYDRETYVNYTKNIKGAYHGLYMFCFKLAKPEQSRNIDMETSMALWSVILCPKYPVMKEVLEFIAENENVYKATNKDLWTMMFEFCETVKPDMQDYETDGAWPTLLDDFVAWKKAKSG
ncbi:Cullin binding-domain-containing protein [Lentinula detonsa]|uniref:Defective in cullin neddylation protein n=1 Tax=Lentinula detonsa TaxID=2804962 RepID=A0AA38UPL4_9AGAR|nr:Cullin binding-domain-containing protein [Lentinula detonsa]